MLGPKAVIEAKRGLGTVAFLKARFDAGMDYLDLLEPFAESAIGSVERDDVTIDDIADEMRRSSGLHVPSETIKTLLKRAAGKKLVKRAHGRYFRTDEAMKIEKIDRKLDEHSKRHEILATSLRQFALKRGMAIGSNEDALALLVDFLDFNHICYVLGQDLTVVASPRRDDIQRNTMIAAFVKLTIDEHRGVYDILDDVVKGLVVRNALLSRHIPRRREFEGLTVFLDTGVLLRALGYAGHTERNAAMESLELIRKAGAKLRVFESTADEIRSILEVYEERLRTPAGVKTLRPTQLTANWLRIHAKPSDIRQEKALLGQNLRLLRVQVDSFPRHQAEYTEDERGLADRLRDPTRSDGSDDARVWHDVHAVAAVLTLRADRRTSRLRNAGFLFVSDSFRTIANVQDWYRNANPSGFQPIMDLRWMTNAAWMIGPGVAPEAPIHQLVTSCTAMLMPDERVWSSFVEGLEALVESGNVSDEESIAVLANEFTWEKIGEVDGESDLEADSVREIVERAEQHWRENYDRELDDARRECSAANSRAAREELVAERVRTNVVEVAERWSRGACWLLLVIVVLAAVVGAGLSLPTIWSVELRQDPLWGGLWWLLVGLFVSWSLLGTFVEGLYVRALVGKASAWLAKRVLKVLLPTIRHDRIGSR